MSEKTEQPTAKKLRDARKKGQVSHSKDASSALILIALFVCLGLGREFYLNTACDLMKLPPLFYKVPFEQAASMMITGTFKVVCNLTLPSLVVILIVGVLFNYLQVGPVLSFEAIMPNLEKINPVSKFLQMFSKKNLMELVKSTIKILFLGTLLYILIESVIDPLLKIPFGGVSAIFEVIRPIMKSFAYNVGFAYIVVGAFDFFFQRQQYMKGLMMTKDEVKREYKESEGDPHIKGKRKQLQREMVEGGGGGGAAARAKQSSVLVTNPTHYAIALYYEKGQVPLPIVLAKGTDQTAKTMIKAAQSGNVPIMENVPLAHALFDMADVNQYIPSELIEPVAEVLRWVYELKKKQAES